MRILIALCPTLLAIAGCGAVGGSTHVIRTTVDGRALLDSKVWIGPRIARFDCRGSASGRCHYVLYRDACAPKRGGACTPRVFDRFALVSGARHDLLGLPGGFAVCVSERANPPMPGCAAVL